MDYHTKDELIARWVVRLAIAMIFILACAGLWSVAAH
jgi:hypothetical protein